MFTSLLRRTSTVAVLVVAATALVSGTTATSAGPHATSISIRAANAAVKPGGTTTILGNLRVGTGQALPGKTVTLQARLTGDDGFLPIGTAVSGPKGGLAVKVTPAETTRYRWVYAGDAATRASRSGVVTVAVRVPSGTPTRLPSTLSIRAERPVVSPTGTDTVSGRLLSRTRPLKNQIVVLLVRVDGSTTWSFVAAKRTGTYGRVAFLVRPTVGSNYKLLFQGTPKYRKARSGVVHVAIRSTKLTSAVSATTVASGGSATVSGVLTKSGAPYPDQAVQLWGKPAGTDQKFAALASASTLADGSVAFTVTPTRKMHYFLFFPKTAEAPAAQSPTRTIGVS